LKVIKAIIIIFAKVIGGGRFDTLGPQYPRYHIIIHGPYQ